MGRQGNLQVIRHTHHYTVRVARVCNVPAEQAKKQSTGTIYRARLSFFESGTGGS